jgi:hypothetical protein
MPPGLTGVFCWHHIQSVTVGVSTDYFSFDIPFISHNKAQISVLNMPPGLNGILCWQHTKFVTVW